MDERFPLTTTYWKQLQVRTLTKARAHNFTFPEVRRASELYMVLPDLRYSVVQVIVVEEQVAVGHKHQDCQLGCTTAWDWTPIV